MSPSIRTFVAAALACLGVAAPTGGGGSPQCSPISVVANFDDITVIPAVNLSPIPTPYRGLYYQAFTPTAPLTVGPGPIPHSDANIARTAAQSQLTGGTPMLSVNYPNSAVKSFSLESFYFDCLVGLGQGVTAPPTGCSIAIAGYRGNDNQVSAATQVCAQQFRYNPTTSLGRQQMAFSGPVLSCFADIQFLIVQFSLEGGMALANSDAVLNLDDVKYSYKTC